MKAFFNIMTACLVMFFGGDIGIVGLQSVGQYSWSSFDLKSGSHVESSFLDSFNDETDEVGGVNLVKVQQEPEFREMFNGKDLDGWKTQGNWVMEAGNVVALKPRPGESGWQRYQDYLTTERKYGNFELELEFKFNKAGNSGVFMRVGDLKDHVASGFEVQILDTHGKKKFGHHDCGGVIRTSAPSKMMVKPAGQWNRYKISLQDHRLQVILNGEKIQDLDLSKTAMKDRPATGYISFQDEAKPIWYRNVRIKEIK